MKSMVLLYHWSSFHHYLVEIASAKVKSDKHPSNTQKVLSEKLEHYLCASDISYYKTEIGTKG